MGLCSEDRLIAETIGQRLPISHIQFGGGTPIIMSPATFVDPVSTLRHPYFAVPDFDRASLDVQSFDPAVQRAVNHRGAAVRYREGYTVTEDDRFRADIIERVMCHMAVDLSRIVRSHDRNPQTAVIDRMRLERLVADGAVSMKDDLLSVSDGAEFPVCSVTSAFDAHLAHSVATHSRAV